MLVAARMEGGGQESGSGGGLVRSLALALSRSRTLSLSLSPQPPLHHHTYTLTPLLLFLGNHREVVFLAAFSAHLQVDCATSGATEIDALDFTLGNKEELLHKQQPHFVKEEKAVVH